MTVEPQFQLRLDRLELPAEPFRDGVAAAVADEAGTIVFTVSRWAEPAGGGHTPVAPWTVVAADGDIDHDTAPLLRYALVQALDDHGPVCCDLTRVTFFGAAAVDLVLRMHARAAASGQRFLLRGAPAMTERLLALVDPDRSLERS